MQKYIPTTSEELRQDNSLYVGGLALSLLALGAAVYLVASKSNSITAIAPQAAVQLALPAEAPKYVFELVQADSGLAARHLRKVVYSIIPPWAPIMRDNIAHAPVDEVDVSDLENEDHCDCAAANETVATRWGERTDKK